MKKRKILLGLALASASMFTLASCGGVENNDGSKSTESSSVTASSQAQPSNTESSDVYIPSSIESSVAESSAAQSSAVESSAAQSSAVESSAAQSSAVESSAAQSSAAASSAAQSSQAEASSAAASSTAESSAAQSSAAASSAAEASSAAASSEEEVEKYTVKFKVGDDVIYTEDVEEDANVTAVPTLADINAKVPAGKRFDYWANASGVAQNPYKDIVSDTTFNAVLVDADDYDTLAADSNNLFASTFYGATITEGNTSFDGTSNPELKSNAATAVSVNISNKVALAAAANTSFLVDLGNKKVTETGIITIYQEVKFDGIANGEGWLQVNGTSVGLTNGGEIFGLRTKKDEISGSSTNGSNVLCYRIDGGADQFSNFVPKTTDTYKIKIVLDTADNVATVYVDGVALFEDIQISLTKINGVKYTSKAGTAKSIDNIAINYEAKEANQVVKAQNALYDVIDEYIKGTEYAAYDSVIQTAISGYATTLKAEIAKAETVDQVNDLGNNWNSYLAISKYVVTVKPYTAASTPATDLEDKKFAAISTNPDLTDIKFSGYTVGKIYTDEELTTEYDSAVAIDSDTVLYIAVTKQTELNEYTLTVADEFTATADKQKVAAGSYTVGDNGFFTLVSNGSVEIRFNGTVTTSIELGKNFASYFTFTLTKEADVSFTVSSTGGSNTTTGFGYYTDAAGTTLATGVTATSVTGTAGTEVKATLAAGTYYFGYTESARTGRILSAVVTYKA